MGEIAGPTYPEISERLRLREQREAHKAALVAAWRARHPEATCPDAAALILAELQRDFGGASLRPDSEEA